MPETSAFPQSPARPSAQRFYERSNAFNRARQPLREQPRTHPRQLRKVTCATASWSACGLTPPSDRERADGYGKISAERSGAGVADDAGRLGSWLRYCRVGRLWLVLISFRRVAGGGWMRRCGHRAVSSHAHSKTLSRGLGCAVAVGCKGGFERQRGWRGNR
jgi:hypothetical protein